MPAEQTHLFRHGKPEDAGDSDRCKGARLDVPLSREGERQTAENIRWLERRYGALLLSRARVVTSPLVRTRRFGELMHGAYGTEHVVDGNLHDIDVGEWEDLSWSEIERGWPEMFERVFSDARGITFPGGDNVDEFTEKTVNAWNTYVEDDRELQLFCLHRASNKAILSSIDGRTLHFGGQDPGCMNHVARTRDGLLHVLRENDILYACTPVISSHLPALRA